MLSRQVFKMDYCIKTRGDERNLGKHATTQPNTSRENLTQDLPGISFAPIFQFPTGNDAGSDKEKPQGAVSLVPNERYIRCKVTRSVISKMLAIACSSMEIVCSMNWVESQFLSWQKVGAQARPPSWNLDLYSRHNDLLIVYESSYDIGSTMHQNFGHFS